MKRIYAAGLVLVLASTLVEAQPRRAEDMTLERAGFVIREADTPKKAASMKRLPPRQFVSRTTPQGRYYLYAEPDYCKCVFVGSEQAMANWRTETTKVPPSQMAPTIAVAPRGATATDTTVLNMDADLADLEPDDILHYRF